MTIRRAMEAYKSELFGSSSSSVPSTWIWNPGVVFEWGRDADYFFSRSHRRTGSARMPAGAGLRNALVSVNGDRICLEGGAGIGMELLEIWRGLGLAPDSLELRDPFSEQSLPDGGSLLVFLGNGHASDLLSRRSGCRLFGAPHRIAELCNSKISAKSWCKELGIRTPEGEICASREAARDCARRLFREHGAVVLKEPFGAFGAGMVVCRSLAAAEKAIAAIWARASGGGAEPIEVLVEAWMETVSSHNSQYLVLPSGRSVFLGRTEQLMDRQKYQGNLADPGWDRPLSDELHSAHALVLEKAAAAGYHGIVGIDSILCSNGEAHPVLELNARLNMSTCIFEILDVLCFRGWACFRNYSLAGARGASFRDILSASGLPLLGGHGGGGMRGVLPVESALGTGATGVPSTKLSVMLFGESGNDLEDLVERLDAVLGLRPSLPSVEHGQRVP